MVGGRRLLCLVVICTYEIRRDVVPCGFHNDRGGLGLRAEAWGLTFAKWIFFPLNLLGPVFS